VDDVENFVDGLLTRPLRNKAEWLDEIASHPLKDFVESFLDERRNMVSVCERLRELESQIGISQADEPSEKPSVTSIRDRVRQASSTFTRAEVQRLLDELDRFHLCDFSCTDSETYHYNVSKPGELEVIRVWHRAETTAG